MNETKRISSNQLDVLKEVGTIGAGRSATALAELLNCKVEISLPETKLVPLESLHKVLGNSEDLYFVLDIGVEGEITGRVFFLLAPQQAKILGSTLLGKSPEEADLNDGMFLSSLKEMVNILVGAYMNVLSDMTGFTIMYTTPSIAMDMVGAIMDFFFIHIAQHSDEAIFIRTELKVRDMNFGGCLLFFPDLESLRKLFNALGVKEGE
ncbi:MAG: chemotaxis protein CheC [Candidatus Omnitrophica bacterium]|nr:chemotaxis protein CheC [Candidatus Omnitrophota bacterium]